MKRFLTVVVVMSLLAAPLSAQFVDDAASGRYQKSNSVGFNPAVTPFSLIDFSRVRWSNSYSVSFFSGGSSSGSLGLWNTTMFYDISNSLSLAFDLNLLHNPGGLTGNSSTEARVLPGFSLDFHPSKNFNMRIDYRTLDYQSEYLFGRGYRY